MVGKFVPVIAVDRSNGASHFPNCSSLVPFSARKWRKDAGKGNEKMGDEEQTHFPNETSSLRRHPSLNGLSMWMFYRVSRRGSSGSKAEHVHQVSNVCVFVAPDIGSLL